MRKILLAGIATVALGMAAPAFAGDVNANNNGRGAGADQVGVAVSNNALSQSFSQTATTRNSTGSSSATQNVGGDLNSLNFSGQIMNNNALNSGVNQNAGGAIAVAAGVGRMGGITTP